MESIRSRFRELVQRRWKEEERECFATFSRDEEEWTRVRLFGPSGLDRLGSNAKRGRGCNPSSTGSIRDIATSRVSTHVQNISKRGTHVQRSCNFAPVDFQPVDDQWRVWKYSTFSNNVAPAQLFRPRDRQRIATRSGKRHFRFFPRRLITRHDFSQRFEFLFFSFFFSFRLGKVEKNWWKDNTIRVWSVYKLKIVQRSFHFLASSPLNIRKLPREISLEFLYTT